MFFEEKATNDKEFVITNASLGAFKVMLKYVCYEKFILDDPIDYSLPIEVFKLGHRFQLKRLLKMIEHSLTKIITKVVHRLRLSLGSRLSSTSFWSLRLRL
jgi:hypothetical protein